MDCVYCELIKNKNNYLYETAKFIVEVNPHSQILGHFIIIPKIHLQSIIDLDEATLVELQLIISYFKTVVEILYQKTIILYEDRLHNHCVMQLFAYNNDKKKVMDKGTIFNDFLKIKSFVNSNDGYFIYQGTNGNKLLLKGNYTMKQFIDNLYAQLDLPLIQNYCCKTSKQTIQDFLKIKNKQLFGGKLIEKRNNIMKYFEDNFETCRRIFFAKTKDYGPTWIFFRLCSLIDQLWIKVMRIRTLEEKKESLVGEDVESEYFGIINYCIIGILSFKYPKYYQQLTEQMLENYDLSNFNIDELFVKYDEVQQTVKDLLYRKNHDYGNAWMEMQIESITDQIIIKTARIKNILQNQGQLLISEDIDAQLGDIINYSIFSLIKIKES